MSHELSGKARTLRDIRRDIEFVGNEAGLQLESIVSDDTLFHLLMAREKLLLCVLSLIGKN